MASLQYYSELGVRYALLSLLLGGALYLLTVLRPWKKRSVDGTTQLRWMISLWYLCAMLLGTLFGRWPNRMAPFSAYCVRPFNALREALVSADSFTWSQLILNILVFVPLGLLLVWHAQGREKGRRLYAIVILFPLLIEVLQLVTGLGVFEVDDLLLNALGGALGLCMGECYVNREARRARSAPRPSADGRP